MKPCSASMDTSTHRQKYIDKVNRRIAAKLHPDNRKVHLVGEPWVLKNQRQQMTPTDTQDSKAKQAQHTVELAQTAAAEHDEDDPALLWAMGPDIADEDSEEDVFGHGTGITPDHTVHSTEGAARGGTDPFKGDSG